MNFNIDAIKQAKGAVFSQKGIKNIPLPLTFSDNNVCLMKSKKP